MKPQQIIMLLSNAFRPDPRVAREALALVEAGYRVTIICWDRTGELPPTESWQGVEIVRVHSVQSAYGSGWRQLFHLPRFWRKAIQIGLKRKPDLVHCHDLDTLYAGARLKQKLRCPLIYDAHEHYPALMSLYLPAPLVGALEWWERWLLGKSDAVITASTVLRDEFLAQDTAPVITLGNLQDTEPYEAVTPDQTTALRARYGLARDDFLVAYIGGFSRNRMLLPLIEAAASLPDVHFALWGDGIQRDAVEDAVDQQPNVHYYGWLRTDELPVHFHAADVIYYCLRLDYPGAIYNAPNTLSQAMAAGRPVLANDVGDLGRMVRATDCGLLIGEATPAAIAAAIEQLRDPALRHRLGENGRRAAQSDFNVAILQRQLVDLYRDLLK